MATTYKAGNRITGLSIPKSEKLTYSDNFSTYADQTAANTAWEPASNVAGRRVNIGNDTLELENDSGTTNYAVVHDLGSSVVNTTEWILRFSADVTLSSGSNNWCYIGLFGSDESVGGGTNQQFIAVSFQNDGSNTKFWGIAAAAGAVNNGYGDWFSASGNGTLTSSKFYIQLRRTSATSADIDIFSDPDYSNPVYLGSNMEMSGTSLSSDLRYIKFANNTTSGSGSIDIVMDDVEFYNGVSSFTPDFESLLAGGTKNVNNSTFTETDTGKEHILNYASWGRKK